jgi:hypothetical protein
MDRPHHRVRRGCQEAMTGCGPDTSFDFVPRSPWKVVHGAADEGSSVKKTRPILFPSDTAIISGRSRVQVSGRSVMWRLLILGTLFAAVLVNPLRAQDKIGPNASGPTYPGGSDITYQWDYSCPSGGECSFTCGGGGAAHVTKVSIYVGVMPVGTNQRNSSLFYEFNTRELRRGSGFSVNAGLSTLQCQFNGLTMDYSGPPRGARGTIDTPRRIDTPMSQDNSAPNTTGSVTR